MSVKLKFHKSANARSHITFYGSKEYPTDENVINRNREIFDYTEIDMLYKEKEGEYII